MGFKGTTRPNRPPGRSPPEGDRRRSAATSHRTQPSVESTGPITRACSAADCADLPRSSRDISVRLAGVLNPEELQDASRNVDRG